jgi:hypothetical protein
MQRLYRTEFGVNPHSKPSIYAFYEQFYDTGYLYKGKIPFALKCIDRIEISTRCVQSYQ